VCYKIPHRKVQKLLGVLLMHQLTLSQNYINM
jgi:hypothetical protein